MPHVGTVNNDRPVQEFSLFAIKPNVVQEIRHRRHREYYLKVLNLTIYINSLLVKHKATYFRVFYEAPRNERVVIKTFFEDRLERKFNKKTLEICALIMDYRVSTLFLLSNNIKQCDTMRIY